VGRREVAAGQTAAASRAWEIEWRDRTASQNVTRNRR